jgi:hypothetical protein
MSNSNLGKTSSLSKTTNNIKSANLSLPTKWIESYKLFMKSYDLSKNSMIVNITTNKPNNSLENKLKTIISNRKKYTDKINFINNKLNLANNLLNVKIMNKENYQKLNIVKTKGLNQENINGIYTGVDQRKNKLNTIIISIKETLTNLQKQQQEYIQNSNTMITEGLKSTFVEPLIQKKTTLNDLLTALVTINKTLTTTLDKKNELTQENIKTITNAYTKFTNIRKQINTNLQNTDLKNKFIVLQKNLRNLKVNVTKTTNAFNNFNKIVINTNQKLPTNKKSVNSAFQNRIQRINTSIQKKTNDLETIVVL